MADESKTKKVKATRNIYEHTLLHSIAIKQIHQAEAEQDGERFSWIIPSMAFSVFYVEALCNIYGEQLFSHWFRFESTSFIGKIVMISEFLKIEVDFSMEPWQTLNHMKRFRNALVHAKPKNASEVHEVPESRNERFVPFPDGGKTIESYSSIENAKNFRKVGSELDMMWGHNAKVYGHKVDTVGAPTYETIE